ncbi:MAG: circularly permuted type 2 ATP-grasp protein [Magnetococcales bacterium]|nr:circularly permuted type 2 ATP-grasp protein [Magnetococcales bacterium]
MTPLPGATAAGYDEAFASPAEPRGHWRPLFDHLYAGGPELPGRLWNETRLLLQESGAVYSVATPGSSQRRSWPFDPVPLILDHADWRPLEAGLTQRHHLLTLLLRDLYGPQRLVSEGMLPPELLFGDGGFLFPLWGSQPRKPTLPVYAADLVRAVDGRFQVVSDRTQAPSGHGYALQNRRLTSRLFPTRAAFGPILPLQPFFRAMRSGLQRLAPHGAQNAHIVLLTPGPASETYYEHSLLAHAMGFTLAQGNDLTVRNGRLCLKTLNGLLPVEVLLRRVDEAWCDPLELREESLLGVVGLVQALREGHTVMANPLGSGLLESLALHPFLPAISRFFLGEELALDNPETLWLGDATSLARVLEGWEQDSCPWAILPLRPAPSLPLNGLVRNPSLLEEIRRTPGRFVARVPVQPSIAPGIDAQGLCRRLLLLRAFLHHDGHTPLVMPGGLARVSPSPEGDLAPMTEGEPESGLHARNIFFSPVQGGLTKDVWVIGDHGSSPPEITTVGQTPDSTPPMGLPSRVAENLFWIGRYAERAESVIRLFREAITLKEEGESGLGREQREFCRRRLLATLTHITGTYPGFVGDGAQVRLAHPDPELSSVLLDPRRVGSLTFSLQSLIQASFSLRDRLSSDTWWILDNIGTRIGRWQRPHTGDLGRLLWDLEPLLQGLMALAGLTWENMGRDLGWLFLDLGRRLERAMFLAQLLETCLGRVAPRGADEIAMLERLLALNDGLESFRLHFRTRLELQPVLAKLLQDDTDPRSLVFQLTLMEEHARRVPRPPGETLYRTSLGRTIFECLAAIRLADTPALARVDPGSGRREELERLTGRIRDLLPLFSETAADSYFRHADPTHHLFTARAEG